MKKLFLTNCLLLMFGLMFAQTSQTDSLIWIRNLEKAKELAAEKNLPMMIVFAGIDWCKPCIKLDRQIFSAPEFATWAKANIIPVKFDFPKQKKNLLPPEQQKYNDSMAEIFDPNGVFPLVVLTDKTGKVIANMGYLEISPLEYIEKIKENLNQK